MLIETYTDEEIVKVLNFISFVQFECDRYNIKCSLRNVKFVRDGAIRCAGWFEKTSPLEAHLLNDSLNPIKKDLRSELVAAMNRDDALEILTHEYCHLTQFVEGMPLWEIASDSLEKIDYWLMGEDIKNIDGHIDNVIQLELDNEKRTVKCITEWNLPIDTSLYVQKANAYLQFYLWLRHSRKWSSPNNSPYRNLNILAAMKNTFRMNYKKLTPSLYSLFKKEDI